MELVLLDIVVSENVRIEGRERSLSCIRVGLIKCRHELPLPLNFLAPLGAQYVP